MAILEKFLNEQVKKLRLPLFFVLLLIVYGFYEIHSAQRIEYESNIANRIELACRQLIIDDFGPNVSLIDLHPPKKNWIYKRHSKFASNNNFNWITIIVKTILYFEGIAPQEISCIAYLPHGEYETISLDTKINFGILAPLYLPRKQKYYWTNKHSFELTIKEMERIFPQAKFFPLEKPKHSIYSILKKIGVTHDPAQHFLLSEIIKK